MKTTYRTEMNEIAKETRWTFLKFFPVLVLALCLSSILFFGLRSLGLVGSTIVERKVFENSFQYKKGMEQRAAILSASIIEIDILLRSNPENSQNLINQKLVLNAQLRAVTINK